MDWVKVFHEKAGTGIRWVSSAGGRGGQVINEEAWKWSISRPVKRLSYLAIGFSEILGICMDFQRDIDLLEFVQFCAVLFRAGFE